MNGLEAGAMNISDEAVMPGPKGRLVYKCISCGLTHDFYNFIYTCPSCKSLVKIENELFDDLKKTPGEKWRQIFDSRKLSNRLELKGVFRFHELVMPVMPVEHIIYLGEGQTPIVRSNPELSGWVGAPFYIKNDGFNPSASFKDRGMASAVSYLNHVIIEKNLDNVLGICASTGDTSAAAALYLSYLPKTKVKTVVLLPQGKVTAQQISQPLGSGATVIELPGVFDDCMRVVEELAQNYKVFLVNSKNPVRIQGQKTYAYEIAQQLSWKTRNLVVVVPIGNAGNVTAVMEGFLDLYRLDVIDELPLVLGVQSHHADPIVKWKASGVFTPMKIIPSVAQAAMIGDPVSFPKVKKLVDEFYKDRFLAINVSETEIMEGMLTSNRHGNVVCTQGGESVAGLKKALAEGIVSKDSVFVVDSTSHQLKFASFQQYYFEDSFKPEYEVKTKEELKNKPVRLELNTKKVAEHLGLQKK